jgi:pimeloyl-ACP methyl ester carboxylesterase
MSCKPVWTPNTVMSADGTRGCQTARVPSAIVKSSHPDVVDLEYETFGSPADPAVLLVAGFVVQLTSWETEFCTKLADGGRYVIRFDNRDCGLSTKLDGVAADWQGALQANLAGTTMPAVPYTLTDMANDCIGLLDALDIEAAHLVGASMGGMIAQTAAIEHPGRVRSLTSIMSSPGDPRTGKPEPEALDVLLTVPPTERGAYVDAAARTAVWASKRYVDIDRIRRRAAEAYDRSFYPEGGPRQLAAIYASGDRTEALRGLDVPTLVIHGRDDTLITPSGGTATAEAIPGANLLLVGDMGHDLPPPLWPLVVAAILGISAV